MRVFGFASSLVETLALGLQTYNRARYRQLVKRIGHVIRSAHETGERTSYVNNEHIRKKHVICFSFRMTVCYVSDHWAEYVSAAGADGSGSHSLSLDKLQLEFDHLFLRAVLHVLKNKRLDAHHSFIIFNGKTLTSCDETFPSSRRLGIWLFMSEMPYGTLSSSMLWKVLYVMQCAETAGLETISTTCDTRSCVQALRGKRLLTEPCYALATPYCNISIQDC